MLNRVKLTCRACGSVLKTKFVDLGVLPISNAVPLIDAVNGMEVIYPLRAYVCSSCRLVQLEDFGSRETHFNGDYAYFSSISSSLRNGVTNAVAQPRIHSMFIVIISPHQSSDKSKLRIIKLNIKNCE